jgi:hypothetical protein
MHSDVFEVFEPPTRTRSRRRDAAAELRPTCELLAYAVESLCTDRDCGDELAVRDAGWLLGGLTAPVVINVMHQFMTTPRGKLDRGVQRLGDLCGALLLEFLCHATGRSALDAVAVGRAITREPDRYEERFMRAFALTPERALKVFLEFFANTQHSARKRLSFSVYGLAGGA